MEHQEFTTFVVAIIVIMAPVLSHAKVPMKILIFSGQSNMEGKATLSTLDAAINDPNPHEPYKHLKQLADVAALPEFKGRARVTKTALCWDTRTHRPHKTPSGWSERH